MQPINNSSADYDDPTGSESPDVFCSLGSLIVEGRVPRNDDRGYSEGPHVPPAGARNLVARHQCSPDNHMCKKDENFRKHMLLLWQNNVPISIEVLLCSDCRVGQKKARSVEFSTIPEPGSILLEQWTVSINNHSHDDRPITSKGLFQAVRSYLHFSQLSAWYSSSKGQQPQNVLYRITIPGETFASKFSYPPVDHFFPTAYVGRQSSVYVSVRALPRREEVPRVICRHNQMPSGTSPRESASSSPCLSPTSMAKSEENEDNQQPVAGAVPWTDSESSFRFGNDLRKTIMKRLAAECQAAATETRSDSMESMLGDSLLDPPQSLEKIPPKRYQSPSRCGSPSLEAPDHLLFGLSGNVGHNKEDNLDFSRYSNSRLARQDLLRRRDINLYYGIHPRLIRLEGGLQSPKLSLPPIKKPWKGPCKAMSPMEAPAKSEQKPHRCTMSGKHVCDNEEINSTSTSEGPDTEELGAKKKSFWLSPKLLDSEDEGMEVAEYANPDQDKAFQQTVTEILGALSSKGSTCCSRRSSLKDEDSLFPHVCKKKGNLDLLNDTSLFQLPTPLVTQVYRAETNYDIKEDPETIKPILKTSKHHRLPDDTEDAFSLTHSTLNKSQSRTTLLDRVSIIRGNAIEEISSQFQKELTIDPGVQSVSNMRSRSLSENCCLNANLYLDPLDISFDGESQSRWDPSGDEGGQSPDDEDAEKENVTATNAPVPTTKAMNTFRKSFDSATSMVFHGRTGLPLTSSPAPLRRGKGKFDYDSSISTPHDIKRALFQTREYRSKKSLSHASDHAVKRKRRSSQKILSASAPATITSSNLLGNFEESVLNGRLEPVSTVEGFTAEIGASGSFHPKHTILPVTVFFYTLCDNVSVSSPYLGHINLGKKGYRVPAKGTIQVTLFNPLGTVVKMFVVMYDLTDMPPNSQTFLRQRTLYMPSELSEANHLDAQKWLRYLVHLRFASSKSGKIYLHTDIRMIIFRKSDMDTATDHSQGKGYELRSFTKGPTKPKFSPRR